MRYGLKLGSETISLPHLLRMRLYSNDVRVFRECIEHHLRLLARQEFARFGKIMRVIFVGTKILVNLRESETLPNHPVYLQNHCSHSAYPPALYVEHRQRDIRCSHQNMCVKENQMLKALL